MLIINIYLKLFERVKVTAIGKQLLILVFVYYANMALCILHQRCNESFIYNAKATNIARMINYA